MARLCSQYNPWEISLEGKCACLRCVCVCDSMFCSVCSGDWYKYLPTGRIPRNGKYVPMLLMALKGVSQPLMDIYEDACSWESVLV